MENNHAIKNGLASDNLTKREYFAAMAMQGLVARGFSPSGFQEDDRLKLATEAVKTADALLSELEK